MNSTQFRFGTVGSPSSTPKKPGGSVGTIQHLAQQGLLAFEIGWVRSVRVSENTCSAIRAAAGEFDVAVSVHAPYYINLNADSDEWPKSRQRLMDAARYGFLAGATDIIFHPGSYFERPPDQVLEVAIARLKACIEELQAEGNTAILRPETMGKRAMLGSLQDTLVMAAELEQVEPCLDFAHLHARTGDGTINSYAEWRNVLQDYSDALGVGSLQRLHCHLSGIEYSDKGEQNHLMLAESDFDLAGLLKALAEFNCGGRILCESPEMESDAQLIRSAWKRIDAG